MAAGKKENQNADHMIRPVAYIHTDFPTKFGIPRQSGLTGDLEAKIVFEPEFFNPEAIRGIEEFSHLWLIWEFSENVRKPGNWSATVRPPRLGGNMRVGVFATRSPFRPNPLGLSVVKLKRVEYLENGAPVLVVTGADMMDGTPVFDIKPYVPFADSHPEAKGGFPAQTKEYGRWRSRKNFWSSCRKKSGIRSAQFWPRIPARPTRRIRTGFMAWNLPDMR